MHTIKGAQGVRRYLVPKTKANEPLSSAFDIFIISVGFAWHTTLCTIDCGRSQILPQQTADPGQKHLMVGNNCLAANIFVFAGELLAVCAENERVGVDNG